MFLNLFYGIRALFQGLIRVLVKMNGANTVVVEKLVGNNYNYWKLCMEAFLQGQDLWDLVSGDEAVIPEDTPQNVESRRKWKVKCGKALFALRTSISKEYIEHVRDEQSPKKVWETLERSFTQKNTMRLQFLENDLAGIIQGNLVIPEYFLKVKTLCVEISELDPTEPVSEARLRRISFEDYGRNSCRSSPLYKGGLNNPLSLNWRTCSQIRKPW